MQTETKATHTPGPWQEHKTMSAGEPVIHIRANDRSPVIAEIWVDTREGHLEQDEANARLIAAAPDLLAALKATARAKVKDYGPEGWSATRYCFCDMSLTDDQSQHTEECSLAVAAIAKATGVQS